MRATVLKARRWALDNASTGFWVGANLTGVVANLLGLFLYTYFCSELWLQPGEKDLAGSAGDAIVWGISALPWLLLCVGLDLLWLVLILTLARPPVIWRLLLLWTVIVACWVVGEEYNHARLTGKEYDGWFHTNNPGPTPPLHRRATSGSLSACLVLDSTSLRR